MSRETVIAGIKRKLGRSGARGFLVSKPANVRYISGFTGSSGSILLSPGRDYFLTDSRYIEQAERETAGLEIVDAGRSPAVVLPELVRRNGISGVAFEPEAVSFMFYRELQKCLRGVELKPASGWVERYRAVKSRGEIDRIKKACSITDEAMRYIRGIMKPGISETDLCCELEYFIRKVKKAGIAFKPILVSGNRTSLVHGSPGSKKIAGDDMVLIDFGVEWEGYRSDLTRTFCVGRMRSERKHLYEAVLKSQVAAAGRVRPGERAGALFSFSRGMLKRQGYEIGHSLGHGVGLEIHELPFLSSGRGIKLRKNMVLTVEPGVYLKGDFGVRIEDTVLVKEEGAEVLTKTSRRRVEI